MHPEAKTNNKARKITPLFIYTTCVSGLGIALFFWSLRSLPASLPDVLPFIVLVIVAELTTSVGFAPQMVFSMSSIASFAMLLRFGPLPAALAAMLGSILTTLMTEIADRRRGRPRVPFLQRAFFNMAALGLPVAAAGGGYIFLGGKVAEVALWSNLPLMVLAAVTAEFLNAAFVVGAVSLQTGQPAFRIWKQNVSWAVPMNILGMIVGGGGLALGYQIAGVLGLAVFFLPIALTIYAFRLYIAQTKAQMERQEEIIAERTDDLQKANKELQRLDRIKTSFFSVVNHEMRTPLTAIIGYSELLLNDKILLTDLQSDMLHRVLDNSQRLVDLVNNLLDISRLEEGKLRLELQAMDVTTIVDRAITAVKPMAEQKHISIFVDVPGTLLNVYGDSTRVDQILVNLLSNAVKYTPDTGSVTISAQRDGVVGMVTISVADTGIGIPANQLPFIFDRFVRAERDLMMNIVGTGLGLSITKGLVEAHGGSIWAESEEGRGSVFTFTLPEDEQALEKASALKQSDTEREEPPSS
jgi:signal transduction histidine kinase